MHASFNVTKFSEINKSGKIAIRPLTIFEGYFARSSLYTFVHSLNVKSIKISSIFTFNSNSQVYLDTNNPQKSQLLEEFPEIYEFLNQFYNINFMLFYNDALSNPVAFSKNVKMLMCDDSRYELNQLKPFIFYVLTKAKKHQVIKLLYPESGLHPQTQIILTRLLSMLVNAGIYVVLLTQSDYMFVEFNTQLQMEKRRESTTIKNLRESLNLPEICKLRFSDVICYSTSPDESVKDKGNAVYSGFSLIESMDNGFIRGKSLDNVIVSSNDVTNICFYKD